jgi:glycosyltransferase involved in cell wall biosynthesis
MAQEARKGGLSVAEDAAVKSAPMRIDVRGRAVDQRDRAAAGRQARLAVLIPCHNEASSVPAVIAGFRAALPEASVFVFDNNSTDGTADRARAAGAIVRHVPLQGKGHVVRRMFADVDADVYLLVDGDGTYAPGSARALVSAIYEDGHDLANGSRVPEGYAFPMGHALGNRLFGILVRRLFGRHPGDMLSGYKAMSRRFVKSFPVLSNGFEIETELTIHALDMKVSTVEIRVLYGERTGISQSKLRTYRDGWRILRMVVHMLRHFRPMIFFGGLGSILLLVALVLSAPVFVDYLQTGLVHKLPTAVLASCLLLLAFLSVSSGVVLESVSLGRREAKFLRYLQESAPTDLGHAGLEGETEFLHGQR